MKKLIITLILIPWFKLHAQTWQNLTPEMNASFMDLAMLDQNTCFAVGWKGAVYKTEDGGSSWQQVPTGSHDNVTSVHAINGVVYATTESGSVLRCSDRTTWSSFTLPGYIGNGVYFYNSYIGYMTGSNKGKIAKTTDGGSSWSEMQINFTGLIRKVHFLDENNGFAIAQNYDKQTNTTYGLVLKTTDGGTNWSQMHEQASLILNDLQFTDVNHGYFVGLNGMILKTSNGGGSFTQLTSNTTKTLNDVSFTDQYTGFAVGLQGTILKTVNGGATWQVLTSPKEYPFLACDFSGNTGYILTAGNLILKTTNGGN
jgi:photosystem II stability/assembly factor-like uncharacterized protein